jgi:ABC-type polysaccharide/polyol phosphate transport system ATPase subunit
MDQASKRLPLRLDDDGEKKPDSPGSPFAFEALSLRIRSGERWAVLTRDAKAAGLLLHCAAGLEKPDQGEVHVLGHVSWPVGTISGLSKRLSCAENSRFLVGVYGQQGQQDRELDHLRDLLAIPLEQWKQPLGSLPRQLQNRYRLALSLLFDFDLYLFSERILNVVERQGESSPAWKSLMEERLEKRACLVIGNASGPIRRHCERAVVLHGGQVALQGTMEAGLERFGELNQRRRERRS